MNDKPKVLIQLDSDQHPSVFDSIVAIDSSIDQLLSFGSVEPIDVPELVHGAMFTRGGKSLKNSAIFVGGSSVATGEQILRSVVDCFFGPVRVSVMLDANGANTTAAATVLTVQDHMQLKGKTVSVLAATGSVGQRVCWLLASAGAHVRVASRSYQRAADVCHDLELRGNSINVTPIEVERPGGIQETLINCDALVAAGAAGVRLINRTEWQHVDSLQIVIDLNAVPPGGVEGVEPTDSGGSNQGCVTYGAIGVGALKMKIHKTAIQRMFQSNDAVLDIDEIFEIGKQLNR